MEPDTAKDHDALRPGTRLDEFEIVRVLGAGGFGIVYLALDHVLLRHVAIKEYMPTALAGRGKGAMVSVRASALAGTFALGLTSFCDEARLLARFDHPALVKVHRFWKANGSAYMAMPYYPGLTLKEARRAMSAPPDEAWLRAFVEPLLGALELLHREGVYHRDIAPDNILLLPDGRPVLLDFGSARRVIGDRTQTLTAVLKPNFAPLEQYADEADMRQGPWTDLYALGATVHFMLTGRAPTPAVLRAVRDALPALSAPGAVAYPGVATAFLATIDWTLALAPDDRPQCVASVRQAFSGELLPPSPSPRHACAPRPSMPDDVPPGTETAAGLDLFVLDLAELGAVAPTSTPPPTTAQTTNPGATASLAVPRPRRRATLAALALAGLIAAGWGARALNPAAAAGPVTPSGASVVSAAHTSAAVAAAAPPADLPTAAPATPATLPVAPKAAAVRHARAAPASTPGVARASAAVPTLAPVARPARRPADLLADAPAAGAVATPRPGAGPGPGPGPSPEGQCGGLNFFTRALCVNRLCQTAQWRAYPQCVDARRVEQQRQRRMDQ